MHPIKEMVQFLGECADYVRSQGRFEELVTIEPAQAIAADAIALEAKIAAEAHKAEVYSLEALKAVTTAASPDSEEGTALSDREQQIINRLLIKAASAGHNASEMATA